MSAAVRPGVAACLYGALAVGATACGQDEWHESGLALAPEAVLAEPADLTDDLVLPAADEGSPPERLASGEPHIFYMNFSDGTETLTKGRDDAKHNVSSICGTNPYPKWTGAQGCGDRDGCLKAIANIVNEQWSDFDIVMVTKRPADSVAYSMEMIGPTGPGCTFPAGVGGIAPFDCGNRNEGDVCYAFLCNGRPRDCAVIISQEEAHTFGLAHTNDMCDILYPTVSMCGDKTAFLDKAMSVNGMGCSGSTQNSYQLLKSVIGAWPSGMTKPKDWEDCFAGPPEIAISSPADGDLVSPASFHVAASVSASCPIRAVTIDIPGAQLSKEAKTPPYEWDVAGIPEGDYIIQVTAVQGDTMMQSASASIAVRVEETKACTTDSDCSAEGGAPEGSCRNGFCHKSGLTDIGSGCCAVAGPSVAGPGAFGPVVLLAAAWRRRSSRLRSSRAPKAVRPRRTAGSNGGP